MSEYIEGEAEAIISTLAELEALIELKAGYIGGDYSLTQWRELGAQLVALKNMAPFEFKSFSFGAWNTAIRQHRNSQNVYCRTLDRFHLAITDELRLKRLMTHDAAQAKAARAMGLEVVTPGRR